MGGELIIAEIDECCIPKGKYKHAEFLKINLDFGELIKEIYSIFHRIF